MKVNPCLNTMMMNPITVIKKVTKNGLKTVDLIAVCIA